MMKYFFLTIAFLFLTTGVLGCKLGISPTSDFDSAHYIFIGEVIEVIETVKYESEGIKTGAVGLKIKVSENIYSPKPASFFEVFPLRLTPSCGLRSDTKEIREHYPIGSQVRVIAKEAMDFKYQPAESSIIRLETSIYNSDSIARNDLSDSPRIICQIFL